MFCSVHENPTNLSESWGYPGCCNVLQCVANVAVCYTVLQCIAVCYSVYQTPSTHEQLLGGFSNTHSDRYLARSTNTHINTQTRIRSSSQPFLSPFSFTPHTHKHTYTHTLPPSSLTVLLHPLNLLHTYTDTSTTFSTMQQSSSVLQQTPFHTATNPIYSALRLLLRLALLVLFLPRTLRNERAP